MTYEIVFVPRQAGGSLADAVAAIDRGGASETDQQTWFERLVPAAHGVLGDVEIDAAARSVIHPSTGISVGVRAGGAAIEVPYEGETDPLELMSLAHALADRVERVTGLVGWDRALREPVSTRAGAPRTRSPRQQPRSEDEQDRGGGRRGGAVEPPHAPVPEPARSPTPEPEPARSPTQRHRPWRRFWARR